MVDKIDFGFLKFRREEKERDVLLQSSESAIYG